MVLIIVNGLNSDIKNRPVKSLLVDGFPDHVNEDEVRIFLLEKIPNAQGVRTFCNIFPKAAIVRLGSDADVTSVINQVSNLQMGYRSLEIKESKCEKCEIKEGSIRTDPLTGEEEMIELLRCVRCKIAWYCGRECQEEDWPYHKLNCNIYIRR